MSLSNPNSQKHCFSTKHNNKKRLTQEQVRVLETSFSCNKKLEAERKLELAGELGVPPRQIAIWYQNKRARWKTQSLELDYNSLQLNLETALLEKRRLESEVQRLGAELEKAQKQLLLAFNQLTEVPAAPPPPPPPPVSSLSSCCDDQGGLSSSLHDDVMSSSWVNHDVEASLRLQELYACLMNTNDTSQS